MLIEIDRLSAHVHPPKPATDSRLHVRRTIGVRTATYRVRIIIQAPRTKRDREQNPLAFKCPPAMMEMEHARAVFRIATCMRRDMHPFGRGIMVRTELRVVLAAIATFIMLGGIAVAIHGLLFDLTDAVRYGAAAIAVGATTAAIALNVWPTDPH
nr:DUF2964 domain-containing protein [Burkholderia lata]